MACLVVGVFSCEVAFPALDPGGEYEDAGPSSLKPCHRSCARDVYFRCQGKGSLVLVEREGRWTAMIFENLVDMGRSRGGKGREGRGCWIWGDGKGRKTWKRRGEEKRKADETRMLARGFRDLITVGEKGALGE